MKIEITKKNIIGFCFCVSVLRGRVSAWPLGMRRGCFYKTCILGEMLTTILVYVHLPTNSYTECLHLFTSFCPNIAGKLEKLFYTCTIFGYVSLLGFGKAKNIAGDNV